MNITNIAGIIFITIINNLALSGGKLPDSTAKNFISALLNNRSSLQKFVLPEELALTKRLGINYTGIDDKFLISNDVDSSLRADISNNNLNFTYKIENLEGNYSKLILSIPSKSLTREYIFKDSFLISRPYYYGRNWKKIESKYFNFYISDPLLFNNYSIKRLDNFIESISGILKYNDKDLAKFRKNKINYYLCKDDKEIKLLTGYDARGLYLIPYDYIITTYSCHYHEILHLLINYKLKTIPLYTTPFFQEGFAVAFGGRGGKEPCVILDMGSFLEESGFLNFSALLSKQDFYKIDATMSYPVAGLYNKYLINELGIEKYLFLYKKYSGSEERVNNLKINMNDLPPENKWMNYLNHYSDSNKIIITESNFNRFKEFARQENSFIISEDSSYYMFRIYDTVLISPTKKTRNYKSKIFSELLPGRKYMGEKYGIFADSNEVSIYNFYSNNLIAKYVRSFTVTQKRVTFHDNLYQFFVKKEVFDEALRELSIY